MTIIRTGSIRVYSRKRVLSAVEGPVMKHFEKYLGIILLIIAVGFNLWTYRTEPTALVDPNDNTFQFALVDRTNQIWSFAQQKCTGISKPFCMLSLLADHWVPNWAQGYNLPAYYSHIPQIIIVATWKIAALFSSHYSLFTHYHYVVYFLLSLFPVTVFIALQTIGIPSVAAGLGALIASHLSTDGLYGLDPTSFLWRGYGLSSQLFAMIWLPLAVAYAWRYLNGTPTKRSLLLAILSLAAVTSGHLGMGIIAFMSIGVLALGPMIRSILTKSWDTNSTNLIRTHIQKLLVVFGGVGLLLGYWILPILRDGNYHNISVWDGIWKFDSFGYREVLKNLFNGDLFDFGRFPILTILVGAGLFRAASGKIFEDRFPNSESKKRQQTDVRHNANASDNLVSSGARNFTDEPEYNYFPFAILFVFWLLMYFGRTTWGSLFTLIPGMSEFHLSRFIVGVHLSGLFLIPLCFDWITSRTHALVVPLKTSYASVGIGLMSALFLIVSVYPQTIRYASHNDFLITRGNTDYTRDSEDINKLISTLRTAIKEKPGRVFAGRGGAWGKNFRIAETPMYMHLSTYGIPVILWLPETWSPNSDTEQYFSENNPAHYSLYNVRYVATPANLAPDLIQPFWKHLVSGKTWILYEVTASVIPSEVEGSRRNDNTFGYITTGVRPAVVSSSKTDYRSVVRLWMHSQAYSQALFPELTFDNAYPKKTGLPNFRMLDEVTYKVPASTRDESTRGGPDKSVHNLFAENPLYVNPISDLSTLDNLKVTSQSAESDMVFKASVQVPKNCVECVVILRQSFHPSWRATIDGKPVRTFVVFPFYTAITVEQAGNHSVVFSYTPTLKKQLLLAMSLITLVSILVIAWKHRT